MEILIPILIVAGIGLLAGIVLAIASVVMAVEKDARAEAVLEVLPGANCGACGYSGCSGYAAALAKGEAAVGLCAPGGEECAAACAAVLGVEAAAMEKKAAVVFCSGSNDNTEDKMLYDGISSCSAAALVAGGVTSCRFGCMGLGDCMQACPYQAITLCNGVALVDPERCRACGKCVAACPKHLIRLTVVKKQAVVRCSSCEKGAQTMKTCKVGCIGCGKCMKACTQGAIQVKNFCAVVDPQKCVGCGDCAQVCPRHIIDMQ